MIRVTPAKSKRLVHHVDGRSWIIANHESITGMGLDVVELVLECEESFNIKLEDWKLERVRTVGDLFELICEQLKLPFGSELPRPNNVPAILRTIRKVAPVEG